MLSPNELILLLGVITSVPIFGNLRIFKCQIVYLFKYHFTYSQLGRGWNVSSWFSGKSLQLLPPDIRY